MTGAPAGPQSWNRRWWAMVALVFTVQIALIFGLGDNQPPWVRPPRRAPSLRLAGGACTDWLTLNDPTLFALPHGESFSGMAWLGAPTNKFQAFEWTEEPRYLNLRIQLLGTTFNQRDETNGASPWQMPALPEPELLVPDLSPSYLPVQQSTLRIEGDLAQRRLLTPLQLPSWHPRIISSPTDTDILTNTVVQVVVDAGGKPVSINLLSPGGLKAADDYALAQARAARFNVLDSAQPESGLVMDPLAQLQWGQLVFEWYTLPATNAPATTP